MRKIELESLYTPYTLDTYSTFTMDNDIEYILDGDDMDGKTYDDFEWDYNMNGYREALAKNWLSLLRENIIDDVIVAIESDCKVISPREYNFSTDKLWAVFSVDMEKLDAFIEKNKKDYEKEKLQDASGFMWFGDDMQTKLNYYMRKESAKKYSTESYFYDQTDAVQALEYIDYKLIK